MTKVAVLHTSFVFVTVEPAINDLLAELLPDAEVIHFVDSDVLSQVGRDRGITEASTNRMVHLAQAAEAAGADIIFNACSSLGPTMDTAKQVVHTPIVKIDDAMALKAASTGKEVGVLATVPTTLDPTSNLVLAKAAELGREVHIHQRLTEGAFQVLMGGDRDAHDSMVSKEAAKLAKEVDVIVLAQASMARLAPRLSEETGLPVLASPRMGVTDLAERVRAMGDA
ncbi:aspartate/glutamate racemase family protein [Intrasporangium calvum]|uniref:Aspartate/glutamate racemase family protein n=1 Tax=Intrasporangium calvum TaxID=53358 RepID=A0ABT5GF33_9MICO|nr:aspartate/glutamate racemase family protein [Intrasporangium calvum]MDC5696814.1 aspartate/glutamate racemase family protein [Intrasporangium calvum]